MEKGEVINKKFNNFLITSQVSSVLKRLRGEVLKKYDIVQFGDKIGFRVKEKKEIMDELPDGGLARMKEFIF